MATIPLIAVAEFNISGISEQLYKVWSQGLESNGGPIMTGATERSIEQSSPPNDGLHVQTPY